MNGKNEILDDVPSGFASPGVNKITSGVEPGTGGCGPSDTTPHELMRLWVREIGGDVIGGGAGTRSGDDGYTSAIVFRWKDGNTYTVRVSPGDFFLKGQS